nr:MAG TPA: hypothetical protein [Caudoviricetes sp.]
MGRRPIRPGRSPLGRRADISPACQNVTPWTAVTLSRYVFWR